MDSELDCVFDFHVLRFTIVSNICTADGTIAKGILSWAADGVRLALLHALCPGSVQPPYTQIIIIMHFLFFGDHLKNS
jgi:hypothetical protein